MSPLSRRHNICGERRSASHCWLSAKWTLVWRLISQFGIIFLWSPGPSLRRTCMQSAAHCSMFHSGSSYRSNIWSDPFHLCDSFHHTHQPWRFALMKAFDYSAVWLCQREGTFRHIQRGQGGQIPQEENVEQKHGNLGTHPAAHVAHCASRRLATKQRSSLFFSCLCGSYNSFWAVLERGAALGCPGYFNMTGVNSVLFCFWQTLTSEFLS